jgi:large subunit ribosomal protein L13
MPSFVPRASDVRNDWFVLNGEDQVLGRLASRAAVVLMGKHKADYTPFLKTGDHVIVVNADKIRLTGRKEEQKKYYRHSGYPGGIKEISAKQMREKHPERIVGNAVRGMLPKNKLGKQLARRLKVYAGPQHPHEAQQPHEMSIGKQGSR